jgi:hypothetical protein
MLEVALLGALSGDTMLHLLNRILLALVLTSALVGEAVFASLEMTSLAFTIPVSIRVLDSSLWE